MVKKKDPPGLKLRIAASERLAAVLKGANFAPFSVAELPDGRDRGLANRLVTTALRRHGHLNIAIRRYLERGIPKKSGNFEALLRLSLTQLLFLPDLGDHSALFLAVEATRRDTRMAHLGKLMNAVLRRAQADAEDLRNLPLAELFPDDLRRTWQKAYGEEAIDGLAAALLDGAPLDLTLRDTDPELIAALGAVPILADTVRIAERDRTVEALPGYAEGRWWVQDAAAAIPARLFDLPPGARVLDLCAAPGGKTAQLVKAGYRVTALDIDPDRLARVKDNLDRLGYTAELVAADATTWQPTEKFDGILIDAPCSATGTLRRHPEVVWHRQQADISGRSAIQKRFIAAASQWLTEGGVMIYSVCSLEPHEGEGHLKDFETNGLTPMPITPAELPELPVITAKGCVRTRPGIAVPGDNTGTLDGFFVARFRRG